MNQVKVALIALLICTSLVANVPARYLAGTYQPLAQEYKAYSPLRGVSLLESGWLSNFYDLGPDDAMHKIVADNQFGLFRKLPNDPALAPSTSSGNVTNFLYNATEDLHADIARMIVQQDFSATTKQAFVNTAFTRWQSRQTQKRSTREERQFKTRTEKFLATIQEALEQEKLGLYAPDTTVGVVLGHLDILAQGDRKPFIAYAQQLETLVPGVGLYDALQTTKPFTAESPEEPENPEYILFKALDVERLPLTDNTRITVDNITFPDCVESALNNLFNTVLYNEKTRKFDLGLLPPSIEPTKEFMTFYTTVQPSPKTVGLSTSKEAWARVVGNNNSCGIIYKSENMYNISSDYRNIVRTINCLLNTTIQRIDQLGSLLSTPTHTVQLAEEKGDKDAILITVIINAMMGNALALNIKVGHTACSYKTESEKREIRQTKPDNVIIEFVTQPISLDNSYLMYSTYIDTSESIDQLLYKMLTLTFNTQEQEALPAYLTTHLQHIVDSLLQKAPNKLLFAALAADDSAMVSKLLTKNIDLNKRNQYGLTPLATAIRQQNFANAKILLDAGADINTGSLEDTIQLDNIEGATFLVEHGIDVNKLNEFGEAPLKWAIVDRKIDFVRLFLEHGASRQEMQDYLETAVFANDTAMVKLLLDFGATINQQTNLGALLEIAEMHKNQNMIDLLQESETTRPIETTA